MLWLAGPIMLLIAGIVGWGFLRNCADHAAGGRNDTLSAEEQERLRQILEE
jgi:cytochrome c-type biogenesis protein CcmH